MDLDQNVSRGRFIRNLGKLAAIGVGIALVPAQMARAEAGTYCCRDPECGANLCNPGQHGFKCWDSCTGGTCCVGCPGFSDCQYSLPCLC